MMHLTLFDPGGLVALAQVLMIDVVLAGDNAVVIGLAAARVPAALRRKVIMSRAWRRRCCCGWGLPLSPCS